MFLTYSDEDVSLLLTSFLLMVFEGRLAASFQEKSNLNFQVNLKSNLKYALSQQLG